MKQQQQQQQKQHLHPTNYSSQLNQLLANVSAEQNVKQSIRKICDIVKKHGIGDDQDTRLAVYKVMLDISEDDIARKFSPLPDSSAYEEDANRIRRDCNASFRLFDVYMNSETSLMQQKRSELAQMMIRLFHDNPEYHYYRGFETFASILLWHYGIDKSYNLISKIASTLMRQVYSDIDACMCSYPFSLNTDALQVEIEMSVSQQVNNIFAIISKEDEQVGTIFSVTHFLAFCVGWVLTWWAMNIRKSSHVLRIYDYLICAGPEGVVLLGAAFILGTKEIMKEHIQECYDGGEIGVLFGIYQNIWQVDYDIDHIMELALQLEKKSSFTEQMRSKYSPESIMHEPVLLSLNPVRIHVRKENKKLVVFSSILLASIFVLFLSFIKIFYPV